HDVNAPLAGHRRGEAGEFRRPQRVRRVERGGKVRLRRDAILVWAAPAKPARGSRGEIADRKAKTEKAQRDRGNQFHIKSTQVTNIPDNVPGGNRRPTRTGDNCLPRWRLLFYTLAGNANGIIPTRTIFDPHAPRPIASETRRPPPTHRRAGPPPPADSAAAGLVQPQPDLPPAPDPHGDYAGPIHDLADPGG